MQCFVGLRKNKNFCGICGGIVRLASAVLVAGCVWVASCFMAGEGNVNAVGGLKDSANAESQTMRVLIVEINPHLTTVSGHPKVNDYFFGGYASAYPEEKQIVLGEKRGISGVSVNEQIEDLEFASHGYLDIEIEKWEYIDAFPRYTSSFTLPDGSSGFAFNETNFLAAAGNVGGTSGWQNLYNGCWFAGSASCGHTTTSGVQAVRPPASYSFSYSWLLNELNLIERRNNNEFDQVWLVSIDPSMSFETMMVGRNAYWINGSPRIEDCDNFIIAGTSPSRRDAQLHSFAHAIENIMGGWDGGVYETRYDAGREATEITPSGKKPSFNVSTAEEYLELNPWERFILNDYANLGTLNGVGTVHYAFNATSNYGYASNKKVKTTYLEWQNRDIDEMTGESSLADSSVWRNTDSIFYVSDFADSFHMWNPGQAVDRFYSRFWMYSLPHAAGYTKDGYLKNWWKYMYLLDYVTEIAASDTDIDVKAGDEFALGYVAEYRSGDTEDGGVNSSTGSVEIADTSVVKMYGNKFKALGDGDTTVTFSREGKSVEYHISVSGADESGGGDESDKEEGKEEIVPTPNTSVDDGSSPIVPDTGAGIIGSNAKSVAEVVAVIVPVLAICLASLRFVSKHYGD